MYSEIQPEEIRQGENTCKLGIKSCALLLILYNYTILTAYPLESMTIVNQVSVGENSDES